MTDLNELYDEIAKLKAKNARLHAENEKLQIQKHVLSKAGEALTEQINCLHAALDEIEKDAPSKMPYKPDYTLPDLFGRDFMHFQLATICRKARGKV